MTRNGLPPHKRAIWDRIERLSKMVDTKTAGDPKIEPLIERIGKLNVALQVED
ncbi:MAG: hypothetical protein ABSA39_22215 [Edaphobacter sp.]